MEEHCLGCDIGISARKCNLAKNADMSYFRTNMLTRVKNYINAENTEDTLLRVLYIVN